MFVVLSLTIPLVHYKQKACSFELEIFLVENTKDNSQESDLEKEDPPPLLRLPCGIGSCPETVSKARYFSYNYYYL